MTSSSSRSSTPGRVADTRAPIPGRTPLMSSVTRPGVLLGAGRVEDPHQDGQLVERLGALVGDLKVDQQGG